MHNPGRKLLMTRMRQELSNPVLEPQSKSPRKSVFKRSCELCKKYGGVHTTHTTKDCCRYKKDGTVKANFSTAKKAGKKPNSAKQLFVQ
jgi:hypothetical protein